MGNIQVVAASRQSTAFLQTKKHGGALPRRRYGRSAEAAFRGFLIEQFRLIFADESFAKSN
jgi:hypothetical protein